MTEDPILGPAFPEFGWVPAPRYLMRRNRILALTENLRPGRLLEVGPGAGALLVEFARRGFDCSALESSAEAREIVHSIAGATRADIEIHKAPAQNWDGRFDTMFAFDVLEHIEDGCGALAQWRRWVRDGGTLVLSVPARMKLWTAGDEWAGHYRRYERDTLIALIETAGFHIERLECYGFPLTNITEKASAPLYRRAIHMRTGSKADDRKRNNDRSGTDRRLHVRMFGLIRTRLGRAAMRTFYRTQSAFLNRDIGSGYVVLARARAC